jgi:hypothetical protein
MNFPERLSLISKLAILPTGSRVSTYPERVPLNGTWSRADAGLGAEINIALQVRSVTMMRLLILGGVFIAAVSFY